MKNLIILLVTIFLFIPKLFSQVNLQSGSATFSLPIFNWKDNQSRLNDAILLNYNSGKGLEVNSVASNVGTGWNLLAGGVITRMQVGFPDDQLKNDGNGTIYDNNKYPAGYLYNNAAGYSWGAPDGLKYYPIFPNPYNLEYRQHNIVSADKEMDYFSFEFKGRNGVFILLKDYNLNVPEDKGYMLGDSKIKITCQRDNNMTTSFGVGIRTSIKSFQIQDEDGFIYKFNRHAYSKVLTEKSNFGNIPLQSPIRFEDYIPYNYNPFIIYKWYLEEINDPLTNRSVFINYSTTENLITSHSGYNFQILKSDNNTQIPQITVIPTIQYEPSLEKIIYPDGYFVNFEYDKTKSRYDLNGDYALKSIQVNYKTRVESKYLLNTQYVFFNNIGTPKTLKETLISRLYLKSVTKYNVDLKEDNQPYTFDYYLGSNNYEDFVPPAFYPIKDAWGYYNGDKLNSYLNTTDKFSTNFIQTNSEGAISYQFNENRVYALCFVKSSNVNMSYNLGNPRYANWWSSGSIKPNYAQNGLLKQVIFPTAGKIVYEYSQNYGTCSIKNWANWNGNNDLSTLPLVNFNDMIGGVHVSRVTNYDNFSTTPNVTNYSYPAIELYDNPSDYYETLNWTYTRVELFDGKNHLFNGCTYNYKYLGSSSTDLSFQQQHQDVGNQKFVNFIINVISLAADIITANLFSILVDGSTLALTIFQEIDNITTGCKDYSVVESCPILGQSNYFLNPLPLIFDHVTVSQPSIGKTVYSFTTPSDCPTWDNENCQPWEKKFNYSLSFKQRYPNWAYGLNKKVSAYNENGDLVSEYENFYDFSNSKENIYNTGNPIYYAPEKMGALRCVANATSSERSTDWINRMNSSSFGINQTDRTIAGACYYFIYDPYYYYTGRVVLTKTIERYFQYPSTTIKNEKTISYTYNSNYQINSISTTQNNGDKLTDFIYYPQDYSSSNNTTFNVLNQNNIINLPLAKHTYISKLVGGTTLFLHGSYTEYTTLPNGNIKPSNIYSSENLFPQSYSFDNLNPLNFPGSKVEKTFSYDLTGNLKGLYDKGGHKVTNLYDYDSRYLTAIVNNADPQLDNPCYTSFETNQLGGWISSNTPLFVENSGVTGNRSFNLTYSPNQSLSTTISNSLKSYKISFWSTAPINVLSDGQNVSSIKNTPTINGYTYYEYFIQSGKNSLTLLAANNVDANIDELRLQPYSSLMKTTTYDPLIGKTSECDENNKITYYYYDNLGRLVLIKDEKMNILKMYEYNTQK